MNTKQVKAALVSKSEFWISHHAYACEDYARMAMVIPQNSVDSVEAARPNTLRQLSSFHAMKAFELSAQAVRS